MNFVKLGIPVFTDPVSGKPVSSGFVYIGEPDLDPTILANQKTIYFRQEDGTEILGSQPVNLSGGGVPIYNGSSVQILVDGNYSIKVLNKNDSQVYYVENAFDGEPVVTGDSFFIAAYDTLADLKVDAHNASILHGNSVYLKGYNSIGDGGHGSFHWSSSNHSADVAIDTLEGVFVPLISDPTGATGCFIRDNINPIYIEQFGIITDGVTTVSGDDVASVFIVAKYLNFVDVASYGGTVLLSSKIDIYQKFGYQYTRQEFNGRGLLFKADASFTDSYIMRVGGSDTGVFEQGRAFVINGLSIDGNSTGANGIYNKLGQEFNYKGISITGCASAIQFENVYYGDIDGYSILFENSNAIEFIDGGNQVSNLGFTNLKINGGSLSATAIGIILNTFAAGLNFTNCTFEALKHCLYTDTATNFAGITRKFTLERCYFEANTDTEFNFDDGTAENRPFAFAIRNCYFNDDNNYLISCKGGEFELVGCNRERSIRVTDTTYRFSLTTDQTKEPEYSSDPQYGTVVKHRDAWGGKTQKEDISIGWNTLGSANPFPTYTNTYPTVERYSDSRHLISPLVNSKTSTRVAGKIHPVYSVTSDDLLFNDVRFGPILKDCVNQSTYYRIKVASGALILEKVNSALMRGMMPMPDTVPARYFYQLCKYGTAPASGTQYWIEEISRQFEWDGTNIIEAGSTDVRMIGTFAELTSGNNRTGFDIPIYNVDIDEWWGSIDASTNMRSLVDTKSKHGTTAARPTGISAGFIYYDTDVAGYVQYDGSIWNAYTHALPWV